MENNRMADHKCLVFLSTLAIFLTLSTSEFFNSKPVEVVVKRMTDCPSTKELLIDLGIKRQRKKTAYELNVTNPYVLDHTVMAKASVAKWGDGGWKENAFNFERNDPCMSFNMVLGPLFVDIQKMLNMPPGCPIQPGRYGTNGSLVVDWRNTNMKIWFTGQIKAKFETFINKTRICCKVVEAELIPIIEY